MWCWTRRSSHNKISKVLISVLGHTGEEAAGVHSFFFRYLRAEQIRLALPLMPNPWSCACTSILRITRLRQLIGCHDFHLSSAESCAHSDGEQGLVARLRRVWQRKMCLCVLLFFVFFFVSRSAASPQRRALYLWAPWRLKVCDISVPTFLPSCIWPRFQQWLIEPFYQEVLGGWIHTKSGAAAKTAFPLYCQWALWASAAAGFAPQPASSKKMLTSSATQTETGSTFLVYLFFLLHHTSLTSHNGFCHLI